MLGTRERNDVNLRQERANEYAPMQHEDYRPEYSFRGYDNYPNDYRESNEVRYAQRYENIDFYNSQYECAASENVFRPKGKILVGVYAALVVLIVAMLLINAIPAVSAQTATVVPPTTEIVSEQAANQTAKNAESESGLTKGEGYVYNNQTNWFEDFCNSLSKMFK